MSGGATSVAIKSAQQLATYGSGPISPSSRACRAMTNPSSPRPTIAHPTTNASGESETHEH